MLSIIHARSESFYDVLHQIKVDTSSIVEMSGKFGSLMKGSNLPQFFNTNVLFLPEVLEKTFQKSEFNSGDGPKFIMVAARANFTPDDVGKPRQTQDLFTQVYFTDPETGALLQKFKSPIRKLFPDSYIAEETATITGSTTEAGARASIADPFLINPGKIDNDYFFTGAVDLFPMELAHELADEVVVTFPSSLYTGFRELAIQKTFGFSPSQRALHAIQDKSVKWIDISGIDYTNFDPQPGFLKINSRIPVGLDNFASGIQTQFDFGYYRTLEAMDLQVDRVDVRSHLREPISPKLLQKFTCKNAYAWRIPGRLLCTSDSQKGCDRMTETVCTPVR